MRPEALATVCDVVPLVGVNRAFVTKGLMQARRLEHTAWIGRPPENGAMGLIPRKDAAVVS